MARYWFIAAEQEKISKLAFFTFLLALIVILLGAYTRLTDAGLSCPDWPNCYGYLTAPHTEMQLQEAAKIYPLNPVNVKKAWTEMTHRYFAGMEGLLILCLAWGLFKKQTNRLGVFLGILLIALLCVQILLGMLTVTEKLKPFIVSAHLLTGLSILSVLWWAFLELHRKDYNVAKRKSNVSLTPWVYTAFILVCLQITLGGWVSTHSAGLACVDFPFCNGKFLPALSWDINTHLITIHMLHRFGAYITGTYLIILSLKLIISRMFPKLALFMLALVIVQISLGIINIIWLRPVHAALSHHFVAILLLLTTLTLLIRTLQANRETSL